VVPLPGLRRLRTLAALTQGELAARAGVQRQTINRLENGGEAEMPTVRKLAAALDCDAKALIEPNEPRQIT
jgi:transcriptional regulator with XRE-family HTH domain